MGFLSSILKIAAPIAGAALAPATGGMSAALISGGASLIGGMMQNRSNSASAQRQMNFQADMSGTAHQREVADLRAAGLNPALSAMGGSGASTPSGATYNSNDVLSPAVSSALQTARTVADLKYIDAQTNQSKATADLNDNLGAKAIQERKLTMINQKIAEANLSSARSGALVASKDAAAAETEKAIENSKFGKTTRYIDRAIRSITGGLNAGHSAKTLVQ